MKSMLLCNVTFQQYLLWMLLSVYIKCVFVCVQVTQQLTAHADIKKKQQQIVLGKCKL